MYFLDLDILTRQLLPPPWRVVRQTTTSTTETDSGKVNYLKAILKPFKQILNDFYAFQKEAKSKVNLSAQVIVITHHIEKITGIQDGIYLSDDQNTPNQFTVNIPAKGENKKKQISEFLQKIVPAGRKYKLSFYTITKTNS